MSLAIVIKKESTTPVIATATAIDAALMRKKIEFDDEMRSYDRRYFECSAKNNKCETCDEFWLCTTDARLQTFSGCKNFELHCVWCGGYKKCVAEYAKSKREKKKEEARMDRIVKDIEERRTYEYCHRTCANNCMTKFLIDLLIRKKAERHATVTIHALAAEGAVRSFDEWRMILFDAEDDSMNVASMEVIGKQYLPL